MDVPIIPDMFKKKIVILICIIFSLPVVAFAGAEKPPESIGTLEKLKQLDLSKRRFRLTAVIVNADLDYDMIGGIDRITPPYPEGGKYQVGDIGTVMGAFTVYKYIGEYEGLSAFADNPVTFHDLLAVKVNDAGIIVDAFKYTLEWTDSPSLALYRLGKKGVRFKEDIDVKDLHLTIPSEKSP